MDFVFYMPMLTALLAETTSDFTLLQDVAEALTVVVAWFGTVITALIGPGGALNPLWPLLAVGIAVTVVFTVVKIVRSFTWGA